MNPLYLVVIIVALFFLGLILNVIMVVCFYKRPKPGHVLVRRSRGTIGDQVVRRGATLVLPNIAAAFYVPMQVFSVGIGDQPLKVCVEDSDDAILRAIDHFEDLTLEAMSAQLKRNLKDCDDDQINAILHEYGLKKL